MRRVVALSRWDEFFGYRGLMGVGGKNRGCSLDMILD